jgi:hypothetical protein
MSRENLLESKGDPELAWVSSDGEARRLTD